MSDGSFNRFIVCTLFLLIGTMQVGRSQDSVKVTTSKNDSVKVSKSKSDIDTTIMVSARDSVHFSVKQKIMQLRGDAVVTYRDQVIEADVIDMNFETSMMNAEGIRDSTGKIVGFPVFKDKGEEFAGESMIYNFSTRKGRVKFGETSVEGGFYYGSRIKRVDEKTAFVEDGSFTTCDAPHPHFYFNSPKMKVVVDDKVFLDPTILYVEDIPIFALPIGLFFDARKGRRSGIIMPTPLLTSSRGAVLQSGGYYFAVSDNFDTQITADLTTRGGFTLYNESQYVVRDHLNGRLKLTYGYTRGDVSAPFTENFGVEGSHQQQLSPQELISASVTFTSQNLYINTALNPVDRLRQNARTNVSYQRTFYNGMTFNIGYGRDQNISNNSVTTSPTVTFGIPQFYPLKNVISGDNWLRDLTLVYRASGKYTYSSQWVNDTSDFRITENSVIEHRPGLTVTPKLGDFTIQPTVSYSENWWFQRYTQSLDTVRADTSDTVLAVVETREPGFFREFSYSYGVVTSTRLYGMLYPKILGVSAFRHTLQPQIGLQYLPDQSDPSLGFYGEFTGATGKQVKYNRFGSGGIASRSEQYLVTIALSNLFSIKPMQADSDTVAAAPIDLVKFNINTSYDLVADSMKLKPITMNLWTPVLKALRFTVTGTINPYDQALVQNESTGKVEWRDIGRSMIEAGKGLGRLTRLDVQLGTDFSSEGVSFEKSSIVPDSSKQDTSREDLRSRFSRRLNAQEEEVDLFADHTPGWSPVIVPWNVSLDLSYNYTRPNPESVIQSLKMRFGGAVSLTQTLSMSASGSFDFLRMEFNNPIIDIKKRIHCWNLSLNWIPIGSNQGFFLRFSAAAPQLRGMELTKQNTPLYR